MDNITHTLFGLGIAETVLRSAPAAKREKLAGFRPVALFAAFVANSFPDLDYLYAWMLHPDKRLAHLLHHRGHTHTFLVGILEALFIVGVFAAFAKWKKKSWGKLEYTVLGIVVIAGLWGHIFLDSLNSYGVHPFWPFYNGWFFADTLFIIEPWLWLSFSTFLFFGEKNQMLRALYVLTSAGAIFLSWFSGYVPAEIAFALSATWIGLIVSGAFIPESKRLFLLWGAFLLIIGGFFGAAASVRHQALREIREALPGVKVHDLILTPAPANPLCWSSITLDTLSTKRVYRLRRGIVALNSNWVDVAECSKTGFFNNLEWKMDRSPVMVLDGEWEGSLGELNRLRQKSCVVQEFLKFARAPIYWREANQTILSDYRFEWRNIRPFSRITVDDKDNTCPNTYAPWLPPRADLLE